MKSWFQTFWGTRGRGKERKLMGELPDFVKPKPRPKNNGPNWLERLDEEDRRKNDELGGAKEVTKEGEAANESNLLDPPNERKRKAEPGSLSDSGDDEEKATVKKATAPKRAFSPPIRGIFNPYAPINRKKKKKKTEEIVYEKMPAWKHEELFDAAWRAERRKKREMESEAKRKEVEDKSVTEASKKRARLISQDDSPRAEEPEGPPFDYVHVEGASRLACPNIRARIDKWLEDRKRPVGSDDDNEVALPPKKKVKCNCCPQAEGQLSYFEWERKKAELESYRAVVNYVKPQPKLDIDWDWCDEKVVEEDIVPAAPAAPLIPPQSQPQAKDSAPVLSATTFTFTSNSSGHGGSATLKRDAGGEKKGAPATSAPAPAAAPAPYVFGSSNGTQSTSVPTFRNIVSAPIDAQSNPILGNMFSPTVQQQRPERKRVMARRNRSQDSNQGPVGNGSFGASSSSTLQPPGSPFGFGTQPGGIGGAASTSMATDSNPFGAQKLVFSTPGASSAPSFGQSGSLNNSFSGNVPQFGSFGTSSQNSLPHPGFNATASPGFGAANGPAAPAFGQPAPAFGGGGGGGGFTLGATDAQRPRVRRRVRRSSPHR